MSDKSIWFEEVDTALKKLVTETLIVDGKPVSFFVKMPEKEFFKQGYPAVVIFPLYNNQDKDRADPRALADPNFNVQILKDTSSGTIVLEKPCVPFKLSYQMDFWTKHKTVMNKLTSTWLEKYSNDFILPVFDSSGNARECFVTMRSGLMTRDDVLSGIRVFHSYITYSIEVELDSGTQTTEPLIKQVNIEVN